jgi:hypothetical protein
MVAAEPSTLLAQYSAPPLFVAVLFWKLSFSFLL